MLKEPEHTSDFNSRVLDTRINRAYNTSMIIVKADEILPLYLSFETDKFDNICQARVFPTADFSVVRDELKRLSSLSQS